MHEIINIVVITLVLLKNLRSIAESEKKKMDATTIQIAWRAANELSPTKEFIVTRPPTLIKIAAPKRIQSVFTIICLKTEKIFGIDFIESVPESYQKFAGMTLGITSITDGPTLHIFTAICL